MSKGLLTKIGRPKMEVEENPSLNKRDGDGDGEDDDDLPVLSAEALDALKEFLAEQSSAADVHGGTAAEEEVALVSEDWRLSQFWYDSETATTVAQEVIGLCQSTRSAVACVACPTLYAYLKKIEPGITAQLLEYDERFQKYGSDFTYYDYRKPEELPSALKHAFKVIVADPPYLSMECLEKIAQTISFLLLPGENYLLLLTGEVQKDRVSEILGLRPCSFRPRHTSKLGNEFRIFTNYDSGMRLGGWEPAEVGWQRS